MSKFKIAPLCPLILGNYLVRPGEDSEMQDFFLSVMDKWSQKTYSGHVGAGEEKSKQFWTCRGLEKENPSNSGHVEGWRRKIQAMKKWMRENRGEDSETKCVKCGGRSRSVKSYRREMANQSLFTRNQKALCSIPHWGYAWMLSSRGSLYIKCE